MRGTLDRVRRPPGADSLDADARHLDGSRGPVAFAGRIENGSRAAHLTLAVAGLAVAALVGSNLLTDSSVAVVDPRARVTIGSPRVDQPEGNRESVLRLFPPNGPLRVGWHNLTIEGYPFAVSVPAEGWTSHGFNAARNGGRLAKGARGTASGAVIEFWSPEHVYTDPCGQTPSPTIGPLARDLAAAIADLPGIVVAGPYDVTVPYGPPVKHLVLEIPDKVECDARALRLWYDDVAGPRLPAEPGSTILVWISNWGGPSSGAARILVEAETYADASRVLELEVASIVGSLVSNRHAPDPPRLGLDEDARRATVEKIEAICHSATQRLAALERQADPDPAWLGAAARIANEALADLRAIPPPDSAETILESLLSSLEPSIDVLEEAGAAAASGDAPIVEGLLHEYARLTAEKDWRVSFHSGGWHAIAIGLRSCPLTFAS